MKNKILTGLVQGLTSKEVAQITGLTANQVESVLSREMKIRNCRNRIQLAAKLAFEAGRTGKKIHEVK